MTLELINTGSELLLGQILNTHLPYLAQKLAELGLSIQRQTTVPDGRPIREAIEESLARAEIILITGGLGPTSDDLTRDIVAEIVGQKLLMHQPTLDAIKKRYSERKLPLPDLVKTQARVPEKAEVFPNETGTAPGFYLHYQEKHLFILPGPPSELKPMFENYAIPRLKNLTPHVSKRECVIFRTLGLSESAVQLRLENKIRKIDPTIEIGYCARPGEVDFRLIGEPNSETFIRAKAAAQTELADHIYAYNQESLEQVVITLATQKKKRIAVAESCTGGLIAHRLTNVPGSSACFLGGCVVYANEEKERQLNVPKEILEKFGAVSPETAEIMAANLLQMTQADFVVVTTGIAGPTGGSPEKPVGLCYFGYQSRTEKKILKKLLATERETFKYMASQQALELLRKGLMQL
ncbi:MAG: competence/damage-inducible protein A [Verrucomicrobiae bacterium]|nr:competence/damage-inducible protein A [Verrucomicrobiae bacterium]